MTPTPKINPTTERYTAPCADCGYTMTIPFAPAYFLHRPEVSTIVVAHEDSIVCGNCKAVYGLGINERETKVQIEMRQVKKGSLISSPHGNGHGLILPS